MDIMDITFREVAESLAYSMVIIVSLNLLGWM